MPEPGETLSTREIDVLNCMVQGATNKEIANELSISENTVKVHLRRIYTKLGVSSRTEAVTVGIQQGLVSVPGIEPMPPNLEPVPAQVTAVSLSSATVPQSTSSAASPSPKTAISTPTGPAKPASGKWRALSITLAALLLVVLSTLVGSWLINNIDRGSPTPTPEPFVETPIKNSRWRTSKPLDEGLAGMALATIGLDIYSIGGETANGVDDTVRIYNTPSYTWRMGEPKPTAVSDASAAVLFGEIYVAGGRLPDKQPTNIVEAYSPANNAWHLVTALPQPIAGGLALVQDGFLYVFGGWNGTDYLDTVYEYNPRLDSWRPLPPMPQPRAFTTGGAIGGQLYVVGGSDGQKELADCTFFDPLTVAWQSCPDMLTPRAGAGAAVLLNQLYVIGGGTTDASNIAFSEEYNPNSQTWQVVNTPMLTDATSWPYLGVTNVETRIYVIGGRLHNQLSGNTYVMETVFQSFIPAIEVP